MQRLGQFNTPHTYPRSVDTAPASGGGRAVRELLAGHVSTLVGYGTALIRLGWPVPAQTSVQHRLAAQLTFFLQFCASTWARVLDDCVQATHTYEAPRAADCTRLTAARPMYRTATRYAAQLVDAPTHYETGCSGKSSQNEIPEARCIEAGYSMEPARRIPREREASTRAVSSEVSMR